MRLKELVKKIRSKNAGPFLLTIDIFCSNKKNFQMVVENVTKIEIARNLYPSLCILGNIVLNIINSLIIFS